MMIKTAAQKKIERYAETIAKRDGCSIALAINKAWDQHPELHAPHVAQYNRLPRHCCRKCQRQINHQDKFCRFCGARQKAK
jgi:hypothetical protein